jgi:large subunit ribosomal protein L31e
MPEEKFLTLNLRKELVKARRIKKAERIVSLVREKVQKIFKEKEVKIDKSVNEEIWRRGIKKPPAKLKLKLTVDEKVVKVELGK